MADGDGPSLIRRKLNGNVRWLALCVCALLLGARIGFAIGRIAGEPTSKSNVNQFQVDHDHLGTQSGHMELLSAEKSKRLAESERCCAELRDQIKRIDADRCLVVDQLAKSEEQRIASAGEASHWRRSYEANRDAFDKYRGKRERGLDGFVYKWTGW